MVRHDRLRWFGHLEHRSVDDWVSACRNVKLARVRDRRECVNDDMKLRGL